MVRIIKKTHQRHSPERTCGCCGRRTLRSPGVPCPRPWKAKSATKRTMMRTLIRSQDPVIAVHHVQPAQDSRSPASPTLAAVLWRPQRAPPPRCTPRSARWGRMAARKRMLRRCLWKGEVKCEQDDALIEGQEPCRRSQTCTATTRHLPLIFVVLVRTCMANVGFVAFLHWWPPSWVSGTARKRGSLCY